MFLHAYGRGDMGSDWDELKDTFRMVEEEIENARLMLIHFPEQVLGFFADQPGAAPKQAPDEPAACPDPASPPTEYDKQVLDDVLGDI
jgi:hypothetical protein